MAAAQRTRNWSFILYPDSENLDSDWRDVLDEMGLQVAISPLHDKDVKKDGSLKKAHYHVIIVFDSVKDRSQVQEICKRIGANSQPERILNLRGAMRYLTHLDSPKKAHYKAVDVEVIGGLDYASIVDSPKEQEQKNSGQIGSIINIMAEKEIWNFAELAEYLLTEEIELFETYRKNAYFFGQYFKTKRFFYKETIDNKKKE